MQPSNQLTRAQQGLGPYAQQDSRLQQAIGNTPRDPTILEAHHQALESLGEEIRGAEKRLTAVAHKLMGPEPEDVPPGAEGNGANILTTQRPLTALLEQAEEDARYAVRRVHTLITRLERL